MNRSLENVCKLMREEYNRMGRINARMVLANHKARKIRRKNDLSAEDYLLIQHYEEEVEQCRQEMAQCRREISRIEENSPFQGG